MRKPTVYFYCYPEGPATKAGYQHTIVVLAEGLQELGVLFYSDTNYWRLKPAAETFLFNHTPDISPDDCDIVVLNNDWFDYDCYMPPQLFRRGRKYLTVYMDQSDGLVTRSYQADFRQFDFIFKTHFNAHIVDYPSNIHQWAFGLTNRMIEATANGLPWKKRDRLLLSNFRVGAPIRQRAIKCVYPILERAFEIDTNTDDFLPPANAFDLHEWEKTGRRHNPSYYERLKTSQAVSCFGGAFCSKWPSTMKLQRVVNFVNSFSIPRSKTIYQWDSFRLWEAFGAGCLVFHVDFEKYGLRLPVMPMNLHHYVGVDFNNTKLLKEVVCGDSDLLSQIAENGKSWALEQYCPLRTAERFLDTFGFKV